MGKSQSRHSENAGTVVNTVEVNDVHRTEVVNSELFVILYMLVCLAVINLAIKVYKMWQNNLKKKYTQRVMSVERL